MTSNQITLQDEGTEQEYESLEEFYLKVLELLYADFPQGYIDYMLFLYDHTLLGFSAINECCRKMERGWELSENFCIRITWSYKAQSRDTLSDLIRKMARHSTHSDFSFRHFDFAWSRFCHKYFAEATS